MLSLESQTPHLHPGLRENKGEALCTLARNESLGSHRGQAVSEVNYEVGETGGQGTSLEWGAGHFTGHVAPLACKWLTCLDNISYIKQNASCIELLPELVLAQAVP